MGQIIKIPEKVKKYLAWKKVLASNNRQPGKSQRLFRLQKSLGFKSSISRSYSRTFSPAKLSQSQIINTPEIAKDFFARKNLSATNHLYLGVIQEKFHLQNCLNRKSSISRKKYKTFLPG